MQRYATRTTGLLLFALVAAFAGGWWGGVVYQSGTQMTAKPVRVNDSEYPFIGPLVGISLSSSNGFPELKKAQRDVQQIVDTAKASDDATDIGVYFRMPSNAHSFGINADAGFDPGSLLKVPIMIAYLKEAEMDPRVLSRTYAYSPAKETDPLPNALAPQLPAGRYSAERLIEAMIQVSDNAAKDILADHVDSEALQDVFDEMDVNFLKDSSGLISPKRYVTFFSRLYSAAFLSRASSNRALELLTATTYHDGLVAQLPSSVKVAHKYGERGIYVDTQLTGIELHDCGIVYAPGSPYYLCVMTRGKDTSKLAKVIASISAAVYADRAVFATTQ
jgi:beta-lactamase class A